MQGLTVVLATPVPTVEDPWYVIIAGKARGRDTAVAVAWEPGLTLLRAIKSSGGSIEMFAPRKVVIIREKKRIVVPLRGRKESDPNPILHPGDLIDAAK